MFLKTRIAASSIAEVVIALTIIALCFGVASLVFVRGTSMASRFQDVRHQTEIQSQLFESLLKDNDSIRDQEFEDITVIITADEDNDSLELIEFTAFDNRSVWKQQILKPVR
jgi:hypothetical protein